MKLLIDVDKDTWEFLKSSKENLWWNRGIIISVINGTPIPDNAKNIDVLMAVFPKADIRFEGRNNELFGYIEFAGDWLEAPYKGDK